MGKYREKTEGNNRKIKHVFLISFCPSSFSPSYPYPLPFKEVFNDVLGSEKLVSGSTCPAGDHVPWGLSGKGTDLSECWSFQMQMLCEVLSFPGSCIDARQVPLCPVIFSHGFHNPRRNYDRKKKIQSVHNYHLIVLSIISENKRQNLEWVQKSEAKWSTVLRVRILSKQNFIFSAVIWLGK